ncbi:FtsK/SpoIIIE domain-containing protein [Frankia sp. Cj5]|uniref:FtsK/SpoIIIE domain-containing protein n=1 Tax=Frankia sp. Cj5 TaxID=2880978 RepID=UPI001EF59F10|nr:FtsK/SpoIIIE domain-containing protein [Frankia sp. Cj5]
MPTVEIRRPKRPNQLTLLRTPAELIAVACARMLRAWYREMVVVAVLLVADHYLRAGLGRVPGHLALIGGLAMILGWPVSRRPAVGWLLASRVRRRWARACRRADLATLADAIPQVRRVRRVPVGDRLLLRLPGGLNPSTLEKAADTLAVSLRAGQVRLERARLDASTMTATIVRRDPLTAAAPPWPFLAGPRVSLWDPIPVGVDENGVPVTISLPERNVLLGGEPGAGKSAALAQLVAAAALDPDAKITLLDGKLVELACWRGVAEDTVGTNIGEAIDVLESLRAEMDRRYTRLLESGARKVTPDDGLPLHVVVIDELAYYLLGGTKNEQAAFAEAARDLVSRGRAAGIIVLGATQKPSGDVVPTYLRDLFGFRWALRCSTRDASDTILGAGWASQGYSAADIDPAARGVGWLLAEGGTPVRLRAHYLLDDELAHIARRAVAIRGAGWTPDRGDVTAPGGSEPGELADEWEAFAADYQQRNRGGCPDDGPPAGGNR